jgi:hypothetical protein
VRKLRDVMAPGSYVSILHPTKEGSPPEAIEAAEQVYANTTAPMRTRSRAEIESFFAGFDLIEPGLVFMPLWRPEGPDDVLLDRPELSAAFCGVGRKP